MSIILFSILSFTSATSWIMVVHYIDKISEKIKNPIRRQRKKDIYRIISAFSVTIFNHVLVLLAVSRLPQNRKNYIFYYKNGGLSEILTKIPKIFFLNFVLFIGNFICIFQNEGFYWFLKGNFEFNLKNLKKNFVCPFLEESLFTVLAYHSFSILSPKIENFDKKFFLINSSIFALSHLHMKWNDIHDIIFDEFYTFKEKIFRIFKLSFSLVFVTFIYKLYCNWIFTKVYDFWTMFFLHSFCNILGAPRGDFMDDSGRYLKIFGVEVKGWVHFLGIFGFLFLGNYALF